MTLTFELDLHILPLDLHDDVFPYVCPFGRESGNTHTHDVKTITPIIDAGCKKEIIGWEVRSEAPVKSQERLNTIPSAIIII